MSSWLGGSCLSSQFARSDLLWSDCDLLFLCDSWQGLRASGSCSWLDLGDCGFSRSPLLGLQLGEFLVTEVVEIALPVTEKVNCVLIAFDCVAHSIN